MRPVIKLDYTLTSTEERLELVNKILEEEPEPNSAYLEILANYLIVPVEREERKKSKILTENRMSTINKNETSFEGVASQLENGEDGIYNLINESKSTILHPKVKITKKDIEEIPFLQQVRDSIAEWEKKLKTATGKDAYIIKKAIIEKRKEQYIIKDAFRCPLPHAHSVNSSITKELEDDFGFNDDGYVVPYGISLCNPKICSIILCNYSGLKSDSWDKVHSDLYCLMHDFDKVAKIALKKYPLYEKIVECKIDGLQNAEIQKILDKEFGTPHSFEYISSLWRNKIPKLIASAAEDELLDWYYLSVAKGKYKKCSRCGQVKLAHNKYFSKNKTSKDGFYSICKKCRNSKAKNK